MLTLITHIRNEAALLPYWLRHHVSQFDAGIVIDYASTDDSLDIIREHAPHWRIVPSRNERFDTVDCDLEVMDYERELIGWKIALNTTEFMVAPELRDVLRIAERSDIHGLTGTAYLLVDHERNGLAGLDDGRPLLHQIHHGYRCIDPHTPFWLNRQRLIHRWTTGGYLAGRHRWQRRPTVFSPDVLFAWLAYAPWDATIVARKTAIAERTSAHDRRTTYGHYHHRTPEELEQAFGDEVAKSRDLRTDHLWRSLVEPHIDGA